MKACTKCGEVKVLTEFYTQKDAPLGVSSWCRACSQARGRARTVKRKGEMPVSKECEHCSQTYPPSRRDQKFCSRECYRANSGRRDGVAPRECDMCSTTFTPVKFGRLCSKRCKDRSKRLRSVKAQWIDAEKSVPCTDCRQVFSHKIMQFDHIPGRGKAFGLCAMAQHRGWMELFLERWRTEPVCSNCHDYRTCLRSGAITQADMDAYRANFRNESDDSRKGNEEGKA